MKTIDDLDDYGVSMWEKKSKHSGKHEREREDPTLACVRCYDNPRVQKVCVFSCVWIGERIFFCVRSESE